MSAPLNSLNPKFIDSENRFLIYCNSTEMSVTPWDIRVKLMELFDNEGTTPVVKTHGIIQMSPSHAKAMSEALRQTIQQYEDKFGEIDLLKIKEAINLVAIPIPQ